MKLFKKAAALFFCLALALSVMAVTALADDEAQLLEGLAAPQPNAMFKVTLEKENVPTTSNTNYTGITEATTNYILDRDYQSGYEVKSTNDVTFAIKMQYTGTELTGKKIDAFQFTFDPGTKTNDAGNRGVTISKLIINGQNVDVGRTGDYANVYASSSFGSESSDIALSTLSNPTTIGTVTFSFDGAAQNTNLTPTIKTMLVQLRNLQHPQWIVKAPEDNATEYPYGDGVYAAGNPSSGYSATPADGSVAENNASYYVDGEATTDKPIIVNPTYDITVEHFQANSDTGIAEKQADTNNSTVHYYFDPEDTTITAGTYNTLTNETPITGYTFKGWMVTLNGTDAATIDDSDTWAEYATADGSWNQSKSYPKVSNLPTSVDNATEWSTNNASVTEWAEDVAAGSPFATFTSRQTALNAQQDGQGVVGVKFIPVNNASDATTTAIPGGYVGPITLTPVYIRDVYTVSFNADTAANYTAGSQARFGDTFSNTAKTRTDYYTIEDLANAENAALDYLKIQYVNAAPYIVEGSNHNLNKPGYKFVGWTASGEGFNTASTTPTPAYKWDYDATARVNQERVIRNTNPQMKRVGDLELTAEWELDIYFAKVDYWYAGNGNSLILVAVPSVTRTATPNYTYNYREIVSGDTHDYAMFEIPSDKAQRAAYMNAAMDAATAQTGANDDEKYTITEAMFKNDAAPYKNDSAYVLFAYIAPNATKESAITLDEASKNASDELATLNTSIAYNGDVDGSDFISVADFGNVDSLLTGYNTNAHIFSIDMRDGVEARLEADYTTETDNGDPEQARAFASIADVKGIYKGMGFTNT